jgi:uncharacterized membrane protein
MDVSTPGRTALLFFASFLILMLILPMLYPFGSFTGLDGKANIIDHWGDIAFADPLTRAIYGLGDLFCHQEQSRSFIINGSQMAFCQRDVSVLTGVVAGLLITDRKIGIIQTGNRLWLFAGIMMIALTFVEWGIGYAFGTDVLATRVATGLLAGAGIALMLQYFVTKQYEKIIGFDEGV